MKETFRFVVVLVLLNATRVFAVDLTLQMVSTPAGLALRFDLEPGSSAQIQRSFDLIEWVNFGNPLSGAAGVEESPVDPSDAMWAFYRLEVIAVDVAPSPDQFGALVVGTTFGGYEFTSSTRFDWKGEGGNWAYQKSGADTGLLVLTYDEDNNNPARYREEMVLMFATPTAGTYRYSEYWLGLEIPGSVSNGTFEL